MITFSGFWNFLNKFTVLLEHTRFAYHHKFTLWTRWNVFILQLLMVRQHGPSAGSWPTDHTNFIIRHKEAVIVFCSGQWFELGLQSWLNGISRDQVLMFTSCYGFARSLLSHSMRFAISRMFHFLRTPLLALALISHSRDHSYSPLPWYFSIIMNYENQDLEILMEDRWIPDFWSVTLIKIANFGGLSIDQIFAKVSGNAQIRAFQRRPDCSPKMSS